MSYEIHGQVLPGVAASPIGQYVAVKQNPGVNNSFVVNASSLDAPFGLTYATSASAGVPIAVIWSGVAKAIAAASLGAGCFVAVASPNGRLGPVAAVGVASGVTDGTLVPRYVVGRAMENAAAGATFAVALDVHELF